LNLAIGAIDLTVLGLYTLTAVLIGIWVGRGQRDLAGYLLGGRDLPWWAILGSIVATETSTATFLSVPGVAFASKTGDLGFLQLTFGYIIGRTLIVYFLLPLYFRGQLFTAYEVLEERFGGSTKRTASLIFLVTRNLGDGLRLFLAAVALQLVLNFPLPVCVIAMGLVTIVYTVFGGMKSVVWNDCLQMVIYVAGGFLAAGIILSRLPAGWETMQAYGIEHDKFQVLDLSFVFNDAFTLWAGVFGGMFLTLGTHGTDQMMVQRYLCARSQADAGRALIASGFVVLFQFLLFLLLGVGLACFYDLEYPGRVLEKDREFATFIIEEMPRNVGIIGLLLAAVFAAAMSTLSSSLNSSASAVVNDFHAAGRRPEESAKLVRLSRRYTILFGILQIGIGIAAEQFDARVVSNALAIAGFSAGLLLGVFCLGVLTRSVGQAACLIGLLIGLATLSAVVFVLPMLGSGISIAWPWYAMIGALATFVGGLVSQQFFLKSHANESS
jgi:SSS family solute:Na+ symporter